MNELKLKSSFNKMSSNYKHNFKKRFGQNFLSDQAYIHMILGAFNLNENDSVLEIGPGDGALTKHIVSAVKDLTVIEIDNDLISRLKETFAEHRNFEVLHADVLTVDFTQFSDKAPLRVIGNLPYNISTPLLFHLFESHHLFSDMFFMLQKEVAHRLVSSPGTKEYGRLSIMAQCHCDMELILDIPRTAFKPPPKVDSSIVQFTPNSILKTEGVKTKDLNKVVTQAFNMRRKTLLNSLRGMFTKEEIINLNIDPQCRAEQLQITEFISLSKYYSKREPA